MNGCDRPFSYVLKSYILNPTVDRGWFVLKAKYNI